MTRNDLLTSRESSVMISSLARRANHSLEMMSRIRQQAETPVFLSGFFCWEGHAFPIKPYRGFPRPRGDNRKKEIGEAFRKSKRHLQEMATEASHQLEAQIQYYRQSAALYMRWVAAVEKVFIDGQGIGNRYIIGSPASRRKDWVSRAIFSYAKMVSPDSVFAMGMEW